MCLVQKIFKGGNLVIILYSLLDKIFHKGSSQNKNKFTNKRVHNNEKVGNKDWRESTALLKTNATPWHLLRLARQQAGLQVVCKVGKRRRRGQVASVSSDLMTWGTGRGERLDFKDGPMEFPSEHLDILQNKHQLL